MTLVSEPLRRHEFHHAGLRISDAAGGSSKAVGAIHSTPSASGGPEQPADTVEGCLLGRADGVALSSATAPPPNGKAERVLRVSAYAVA